VRRKRRSSTSADAENYRAQLGYLLERSAFYREKLGATELSDRLPGIAQPPPNQKNQHPAAATTHFQDPSSGEIQEAMPLQGR